MNLQIEMFSEAEYKIFGIAVFGFIAVWLLTYLTIYSCEKILRHKVELAEDKKKSKNIKVSRTYEVDKNDFYELGQDAIRQEAMKSFIRETSLGNFVEVTIDNDIHG